MMARATPFAPPDWEDPDYYAWLAEWDGNLLAWEFLRRNPAYAACVGDGRPLMDAVPSGTRSVPPVFRARKVADVSRWGLSCCRSA